MVLDRAGPDGPTLEVQIHVFETTSELAGTGHYVLRNHTLVTLTFTQAVVRELRGFNRQNVISSLEISELDPAEHEGRRLEVELPSIYGVEARLECHRAIVSDVQPYHAAA